jgi:hypothetical protein
MVQGWCLCVLVAKKRYSLLVEVKSRESSIENRVAGGENGRD